MLCQRCNKNVATVFISTIVNGENTQMYLCTDCAKELHDSMSPNMQIPFPINDILSNIKIDEDSINDFISSLTQGDNKSININNNIIQQNDLDISNDINNKQEIDKKINVVCNVCNTSFEEYKKEGKLGCSKCYQAFEKELKPIIESIYGFSEHIGKYPKNQFKDVDVIKTIEKLKEQLNIAIQEEEYEKAAELRDEILKLEANDM